MALQQVMAVAEPNFFYQSWCCLDWVACVKQQIPAQFQRFAKLSEAFTAWATILQTCCILSGSCLYGEAFLVISCFPCCSAPLWVNQEVIALIDRGAQFPLNCCLLKAETAIEMLMFSISQHCNEKDSLPQSGKHTWTRTCLQFCSGLDWGRVWLLGEQVLGKKGSCSRSKPPAIPSWCSFKGKK